MRAALKIPSLLSAKLLRAARQLFRRLGGTRVRLWWAGIRLHIQDGWTTSVSGARLSVDQGDLRARRLHIRSGSLDRPAARIWSELCERVRPTVLLDIGCNYGEISFSRTYEVAREIHLVEANPSLHRHLKRTLDRCGDRRFVLHRGAASDREEVRRLRVLTRSSGLSTLRDGAPGRAVAVRTFRLDERITLRPYDRLVFKIDVEGHELRVLRGMRGLTSGCRWLGLCEFNGDHELAEYIIAQFTVFRVTRSSGSWALSGLRELLKNSSEFAKDVVLAPKNLDPEIDCAHSTVRHTPAVR